MFDHQETRGAAGNAGSQQPVDQTHRRLLRAGVDQHSFRETPLKQILDEHHISELTVVGAMSHMCIDAMVRAAADFGYITTVIHDACATRDLEFNGMTVPAAQVHAAYMAALGFGYAQEYLTT